MVVITSYEKINLTNRNQHKNQKRYKKFLKSLIVKGNMNIFFIKIILKNHVIIMDKRN